MDQHNGHALHTILADVGRQTVAHMDKHQIPPSDVHNYVDIQTVTHGTMHVKEIAYEKTERFNRSGNEA